MTSPHSHSVNSYSGQFERSHPVNRGLPRHGIITTDNPVRHWDRVCIRPHISSLTQGDSVLTKRGWTSVAGFQPLARTCRYSLRLHSYDAAVKPAGEIGRTQSHTQQRKPARAGLRGVVVGEPETFHSRRVGDHNASVPCRPRDNYHCFMPQFRCCAIHAEYSFTGRTRVDLIDPCKA